MPEMIRRLRSSNWLFCDARLNEKGFMAWAFCSGMLFNATNKWWGDFGDRGFPHEGLDFCLYKDHCGNLQCVDEATQIPALQDGCIRAIFRDFLGQAMIIEHDVDGADNHSFLSIYAHTVPSGNLRVGASVKKDEIIGTIADTEKSKADILPHLHLSLGWPTPLMFYDRFEWNRLRDPKLITLADPLKIIGGPYDVLEATDVHAFNVMRF